MIAEKEILARARQFEEGALAEIYDCYSDALYRYAMRLLGDNHTAEECVAETFSRFLHALKSGGGPRQNLKAYLYRIAHNWITDSYRRQPIEMLPLEDEDGEVHDDKRNNPSEEILQQYERQEMRIALAQLTPEQRQVVVLRFLEMWELKEISILMGKPVGSVKALQHRGIAALRRLFEKKIEKESA